MRSKQVFKKEKGNVNNILRSKKKTIPIISFQGPYQNLKECLIKKNE
jgi:hypothetical protein